MMYFPVLNIGMYWVLVLWEEEIKIGGHFI